MPSFKSIAWDQNRRKFVSPSRPNFEWQKGIVRSQCQIKDHSTNEFGHLDLNCTCGIWSSPNRKALEEYEKYQNSIIVLLQLYGTADIKESALDIPDCYVLRTWSARVVGVQFEDKTNDRYMATTLAADYFGIKIFPVEVAEMMIQASWLRDAIINGEPINPYKKRSIAPEIQEWTRRKDA